MEGVDSPVQMMAGAAATELITHVNANNIVLIVAKMYNVLVLRTGQN